MKYTHGKSGIVRAVSVVAVAIGFAASPLATLTASAACGTPAPTTAAGYEQLLRGNMNGKWYHGDAGLSTSLPNGKKLWVYGDTIIGDAGQARGNHMISNSAILTEGGCATSLTGPLASGKATTWIKPTSLTDIPDVNDFYWPSTPFMDGSVLRMFLMHMYADTAGFHHIGIDLATFNLGSGKPVLQSIAKTPASDAGNSAPLWGGAVVTNGGYHYMLGSLNKHETWVFGHYQYLARVAVGKVVNQASWQYWDGTTWNADKTQAQAIIPGTAGIGVGATAYRKTNGEIVLIAKKYDNFGTDIVAWKSTTAAGPYSEQTPALLAPIPAANYTESDMTYAGLAHPHAKLASGKLLVSYSRNSDDPNFFGDARYGNYFAEVDQP